ncbi:uncharacterized protein LOC106167227 [Lingula anatina]|uniref:Uncharacterized protein LOC106167227 n=1 Tax=Lingula anatina TaxID=7574 RepID=A0A1S3ITY9_LINAN|nr:uncharacterized protein LOC106167227 [Lingula anatina]|eukprot:XP_013401401.1 uncharacterized protein LOC106167227 [Lingula anatina]
MVLKCQMDEVLNKVNTNKSALQNTKEAISFADTHTEETTSKIADLEKRIDFLGSERQVNTERMASLERRLTQLEREFQLEKEEKRLLKWEKEAMVNRVTGLMLTISRQHDEIDRLNGLLGAKPPDDVMTGLSKPYEEVGAIVIKITGDEDTPAGGDKNDTKEAVQVEEKFQTENSHLKRLELEIDQIKKKLSQMEKEGYGDKDHIVPPKTDNLEFLLKKETQLTIKSSPKEDGDEGDEAMLKRLEDIALSMDEKPNAILDDTSIQAEAGVAEDSTVVPDHETVILEEEKREEPSIKACLTEEMPNTVLVDTAGEDASPKLGHLKDEEPKADVVLAAQPQDAKDKKRCKKSRKGRNKKKGVFRYHCF